MKTPDFSWQSITAKNKKDLVNQYQENPAKVSGDFRGLPKRKRNLSEHRYSEIKF